MALSSWLVDWMMVYSNTDGVGNAIIIPCGQFRRCAGLKKARFTGETRDRTSLFNGGAGLQFAQDENNPDTTATTIFSAVS